MKSFFLTTLILCITTFVSLAQDTTWYDALGKTTTRQQSRSYGIRQKTDSGWKMTYYLSSGKIYNTAFYSDDSCHIAQGEKVYYNDQGKLKRRVNYKDGKESGSDTHYYDNGQVQATGTNRAGVPDGQWQAWYPSGKVAGNAKFLNGKQVSESFFNEDGSPKKVDSFFRESGYPGGRSAFYDYLSKHLKYPNAAVKNNIQGKVVLEFRVTKEGKMADLVIIQNAERSLDKEAYRVVSTMTDWEPAMLGGMPVDSYKKQPVVFMF